MNNQTDLSNTSTPKIIDRICIIGGGAVGIAIAKNFIQAGLTDFDLIEKEDDLGGTWYFGVSAGKVY